MPTSKKVFVKKYLEAMNNGDAAVFAGAGLSVSSGCVNWKELLKGIAEELALDIEKETDLVSLAQYYVNKTRNRNQLNTIISNAFNTGKKPNENHKILAHLPIATYWTTNYDKLIEKVLENKGKIYDVKSTNENLTTTLKGRDVVVYKMHGDVDQPSQSVLIRDDYESYYRKKAPFLNALSGDLMTKTFLFIGFSFSDPNLSYVYSRLRVNLEEGNMREHYCLMKKPTEKDYPSKEEFEYETLKMKYFIDDLKRFNIQTVLLDDYAEITEILQEIKRLYNSKTIYISGAAAEYGQEGQAEYEKFISKLSAGLIKEDYRIVSGYGLGVGSAVISGALTEIYQNQKKSLNDQLVLRPFPQGDDGIQALWEQYRKDMISYSGISIFLLGNKKDKEGNLVPSNGMSSEYQISKEQGNYLLPIGRTGYISKDLWTELMDEKKEDADFEKYRNDFMDLGNEEKTLEETRETIMKVLKTISEHGA